MHGAPGERRRGGGGGGRALLEEPVRSGGPALRLRKRQRLPVQARVLRHRGAAVEHPCPPAPPTGAPQDSPPGDAACRVTFASLRDVRPPLNVGYRAMLEGEGSPPLFHQTNCWAQRVEVVTHVVPSSGSLTVLRQHSADTHSKFSMCRPNTR